MSARAGAVGIAGRRRDALDDRVEDLLDADAGLGRDAERRARASLADQVGDLARRRRRGRPEGRSILFTTGTISRLFSIAR